MKLGVSLLGAGFSVVVLTSWAQADASLATQARAFFGVVEPPKAEAIASPQAALGRMLFWDTRTSANGKVACASCHAASDWSSDSRKLSLDGRDKLTSRHSQTIFNSLMQPSLRWVGDRPTAAAQAEGSLTGSMGFETRDAAMTKLRELGYTEAFRGAFPADADPVNARNYGLAVQAYEATLTTPAPFDRFLAGQDAALNAQQKRGLTAFIQNGCVACHSGAVLGGNSLQKFGVTQPYWELTKSTKQDQGKFESSKNEADKLTFRVAMLRNVVKTAPYFHDGSVDNLEEAIRIMGQLQLGKTMAEADVKDMVAFLGSLTGEIPTHYTAPAQFPTVAR